MQTFIYPVLWYTKQANQYLVEGLARAGYPLVIFTNPHDPEFEQASQRCKLAIVDDVDVANAITAVAAIPVIGLLCDDDLEAAFGSGIVDCVPMPASEQMLLERIQRYLPWHNFVHYDHAPVLIHSIDEAYSLQYVNLEWQKLTGYKAKDVVGKSLLDFVVDGQKEAVQKRLDSFFQRGFIRGGELDLVCKDGRVFKLELNADVIQMADGHRASFAFGRDISTQRQAEAHLQASQHWTQAILNAITNAVLVINRDGVMQRIANPRSAELLIPEAEIPGTLVTDLIIGYSAQEIIQTIHRVIEGDEIASLEYQIQRDEQSHWFRATISRYNDDEVVWVSHRITQQKRAQLALEESGAKYRQLFEAANEQRQLAETLRDTAAAFNSSTRLDEVLRVILQSLRKMIPHTSSNVMLIDNQIARVVIHQGYDLAGLDPALIDTVLLKMGETPVLDTMYASKQPIRIDDVQNEDNQWVSTSAAPIIRCYLAVPLILRDTVIGFINVDHIQPGQFSQKHASSLQALAHQAAIAIENTRLFAELGQRVEERTIELETANQAMVEHIRSREAAEKALQEERNLLRTVIGNIPDTVFIQDQEGRFLLVNHDVMDLYGNQLHTHEIIGKTGYEITNDHERVDLYQRQNAAVMASGEPILNKESTHLDQHGQVRWTLYSKLPLRDHQEQIIGIVNVSRDITQLKRIQTDLKEERNRLRTLVDTIPDMIYIKDVEGRYTLVNEAMRDALGAKNFGEIIGKTEAHFLRPEEALAQIRADRRVLQQNQPQYNVDGVLHRPNGEAHRLLMNKIPLLSNNNIVKGVIGVNRDITDLKQAEERLDQVFKNARVLLWTGDVRRTEDHYHSNNKIANEQAAQSFLPLNYEVNYSQAWEASILPEDQANRIALRNKHIATNRPGYTCEFRMRIADGTLRWLTEQVQIYPQEQHHWELVGVITDITERKAFEERLTMLADELEERVIERTQELVAANEALKQQVEHTEAAQQAELEQRKLSEALRDSGAILNSTLDRDVILDHLLNALEPLIPHDAANIMLLSNKQIEIVRSRGYDAPLHQTPVTVDDLYPNLQAILRTGDPFIVGDTLKSDFWPIDDGKAPSWVRSNIAVPIPLENQVIGFLNLDSRTPHAFTPQHAEPLTAFANQAGIAIKNARLLDGLEQLVTERTAALDVEQARLRAILNAMRDGMVYTDLNGDPQVINQSLIELTGYDEAMWLHGDAQERIITLSPEEIADQTRRSEFYLERDGFWYDETTIQRTDGTQVDVALSRSVVRDKDGQRVGLVTVLRDISQEKALQQQKARFITSASHELRTPIANLKTRLFLLKRKPDAFAENIAIAESVTNYMQRLVEDMFDLGRFERGIMKVDRERVNLKELLADALAYQQLEAERLDIDLVLDAPAGDVYVWIDPYRMMQVFTNLISNALHYTPQDGQITARLQISDEGVNIHVNDTGSGIKEEDLPHLFTAFYRATDDNRGAGLGLAISSEIIKLHDGSIAVSSKIGGGTTFEIQLPASILEPPQPD